MHKVAAQWITSDVPYRIMPKKTGDRKSAHRFWNSHGNEPKTCLWLVPKSHSV